MCTKSIFGRGKAGALPRTPLGELPMLICAYKSAGFYVAAKATYIRLIFLAKGGFFGPSSVKRGRTHIVLG